MKGEIQIEKSWANALSNIFKNSDTKSLLKKVKELYLDKNKTIYPNPKNIFSAFNLCPFEKVSVVILGQDPYHGVGQANGLSFSVPKGITCPPSLKNIFKEMKDDLGREINDVGDLSYLAEQGVFLLNSILTVEMNNPASHRNLGWEEFTDFVIKEISDKKENVVFMLWGNYAKEKRNLIDEKKHLVLTSPHPSPYSASSGFFGCKHFSKANDYLKKNNKETINW